MGIIWMVGLHTSEVFPCLQEGRHRISGVLETSNTLRGPMTLTFRTKVLSLVHQITAHQCIEVRGKLSCWTYNILSKWFKLCDAVTHFMGGFDVALTQSQTGFQIIYFSRH